MYPVNGINDHGSTIALINIHDLNPNNQALNRRHCPCTKLVPLHDSDHRIEQTKSPTRKNMVHEHAIQKH